MKRKTFIKASGTVLLGSLLSCSSAKNINPKSNSPKFDLHTHPGAYYLNSETSDQDFINRVRDMQSHGLDGAFFSIVSDFPLLKRTETGIIPEGSFSKDEGWIEFLRQLGDLKKLIGQSSAQVSLSANDLAQGDYIKAYISCEGGDFLDGKIENVQAAYNKGVRSIQLVHYAPNSLGDLQTWKSVHSGLSAFGKEVVKKMNKTGMLIDVAHASVRTVKMVTDLSKHPVILSHSILKDTVYRPINARAISIDHAKLVTSNGGLIGMWPSGFSSSFEEFVEHTFRMIDAVGIKHVGIGTDMDSNYKPVVKNYEEFADWTEALVARGLSAEEAGLLAGGNAQRVMGEVL